MKLVFEVYDSLATDKISEEALFRFMQNMTNKMPNRVLIPTDLLSLHQTEKDTFLDLFGEDMMKI